MANDVYGIKKIYPSDESNTQEFILPMHNNDINSDTFNDSITLENGNLFSLQNSSGQIGWWEAENDKDEGDIIIFIAVPGSAESVEVDCDVKYEDLDSQGSTGMANSEWHNTETTFHVFLDQVQKKDNYLFVESRAGYKGDQIDSPCCAGFGYGAGMYSSNDSNFAGKVFMYKEEWFHSVAFLEDVAQNVIPSFYQRWFGVKKVIYNKEVNGKVQVHLELYISPSDQPQDYQNWVLVYATTDYLGRDWTDGGDECDGEKDQPITWASIFTILGWNGTSLVRFKNMTIREIDPEGSFGEDPEPDPGGEPDPGEEPPDTDPGEEPPIICPIGFHPEGQTCVPDNPIPVPPDTVPPATPTTITKRLTIRREIIYSATCSCDGIPTGVVNPPPPPPPPGGGGGGGTGGGSNTLPTVYNVAKTNSFVKLASVDGTSDYYLRYGEGITQTNSPLIGVVPARIEITIAEFQDPRGGTGGGVHCVIRKREDDSIAATFLPIATEDEILNAGILHKFENLDNDYALQYQDKILFEYDGGNRNNYIKIFHSADAPNTGTKEVWQSNRSDPGEYDDNANYDVCMRVYKKEAIVNPTHAEDDLSFTTLKIHKYNVLAV